MQLTRGPQLQKQVFSRRCNVKPIELKTKFKVPLRSRAKYAIICFSVFLASLLSFEGYRLVKKKQEEEIFHEQILVNKNVKPILVPPTFEFKVKVILRFIYLIIIFCPLVLLLPFTKYKAIASMWWEILTHTLQKLGGCWIKLGQWASTRPDLFSYEHTLKISHLVDHCPFHSYEETVRAVKKALQINHLSEKFSSFKEIPIASGAIAQVHEAVYEGERVAVKVLHPNINENIAVDLTVMGIFKDILLIIPGAKWLGLDDALIQFKSSMQLQTNLDIEGYNLQRFNYNFRNFENVKFPKLYFSSEEMLIESYENGISLIKYLTQNSSHPSEKKVLAHLGLTAFLKMMLRDNFVHADLHSGNILVRHKADNSPELVLLDVGLVTVASDFDWMILKKLLLAISTKNSKMAARLMVEHAKKQELDESQMSNFIAEMSAIFDDVFRSKLTKIDAGLVLSNVLSINRRYRVQVAGNFATLCVGVIVLEGIGKQLDPDINLLQEAYPFLLEKEKTNFLHFASEKIAEFYRIIGELALKVEKYS